MSRSSLSFLLNLSLASSFIFLAACDLPKTQKNTNAEGSQGSFFADEVTGNYLNENFQEAISIPNERTYAMKTCLRDLRFSRPIINHPFLIEEINKEVKSDATGCINWLESVKFEFLADPVFVKIDRKIKSLGIHTGFYSLSFAINPWDIETFHGPIDLAKKKISPLYEKEEAELKLKGKLQSQNFDLWVEDGRLFISDERLSSQDHPTNDFRYEFTINPHIKTKKTSGETSLYLLKNGLFSGRIETIQKYYDGDAKMNKFDLLAATNFSDAKMDKGILSFTKIVPFYGPPPSMGTLYVRLYLRPKSDVPNLKPFVGIFPIGDFRAFRGNAILKVLPSDDITKNLESQIPKNKEFLSDIKSFNEAAQNGKESEKIIPNTKGKSASNTGVDKLGFDSTARSEILGNFKKRTFYGAHICLSNNQMPGTPLANQKFTVYGFSVDENRPGPKKDNLVSDMNGCIYWMDSIDYDMYDCHRYFKGYVIIENKDYNFNQKRYYYINPWDNFFGAKDQIGIDIPEAVQSTCTSDNPRKNEIVLDEINFKTHVYDHQNRINSLLELDPVKKLGITLHPKMKVPSDLKEDYGGALESLLDGPYLLRVMIVRNLKLAKNSDSNEIEVLTYQDIPVLNRNSGTIYAEFPYSIKDKRLLLTRNTIFIQLLPLKSDKIEVFNESQIRFKNPNESIENAINSDVKFLSPIFTEEIVLDGENSKSLRVYSGSEYISHLKLDMNKQNNPLDFSKLAADFKSKELKLSTAESNESNPDVFAKNNNLDYFTESTGSNLKFSKSIVDTFVSKRLSFSKDSAKKLCDFWFDKYWKGKFDLREFLVKRACSKAAENDIRKFFDFDHIYFIKDIASSEYLGPGTEKSIGLGTSFSVSTSYSKSLTHSINAGADIGASFSPLKESPFSFLSLGARLGTSIDFSRSTSFSDSNSTSLNEGSELSVTESQFKINAKKYQYCLSIKPAVRLFRDSNLGWYMQLWKGNWNFSHFLKSDLNESEKLAVSSKGLMICQTELNQSALSFVEQYYWITQHQSSNELQDSYDDRNKIFSIFIRGQQEYKRFKYALSKKWSHPESESPSGASSTYLDNMMQMNSWKKTLPGVYISRDAN